MLEYCTDKLIRILCNILMYVYFWKEYFAKKFFKRNFQTCKLSFSKQKNEIYQQHLSSHEN